MVNNEQVKIINFDSRLLIIYKKYKAIISKLLPDSKISLVSSQAH